MSALAEFHVQQGDGGAVLALTGPFLVSTISDVDEALRAIDAPLTTIDLSGVTEIDTVGAWAVIRLADENRAQVVGASQRAARIIGALQTIGIAAEPLPEREPVWIRVTASVGEKVLNSRHGIRDVVGFIGATIVAMGRLIRHPGRFPLRALVRQMEAVGVTALPIIGLMSFLIGIVIAQQGAVQLEQFGAEMMTVNLVGRLTLRELGVLMTAIMVAGRSGSAFAAEIGTMKLTEEVDAMRTIGISPMEVLVIPRILACTFMMILLGFYSSVMAIIGGAVIGEAILGIPFITFLQRIQDVVPLHDLWVGLVKAPVFGLIVGLAGCYNGMKVEGNSEEVGLRTTLSVVGAIFAVIVLDAFFAVFFTKVGWS